jgi:hypothetical protein
MRRRRGDATSGGLLHPQLMPRPVEMSEIDYEEDQFFYDTLDCMNPWFEPDDSFGFDDVHVPDDDNTYFDLEL